MPCFMIGDALFMLLQSFVSANINYFVTFHFEYHDWDGELAYPLLAFTLSVNNRLWQSH